MFSCCAFVLGWYSRAGRSLGSLDFLEFPVPGPVVLLVLVLLLSRLCGSCAVRFLRLCVCCLSGASPVSGSAFWFPGPVLCLVLASALCSALRSGLCLSCFSFLFSLLVMWSWSTLRNTGTRPGSTPRCPCPWVHSRYIPAGGAKCHQCSVKSFAADRELLKCTDVLDLHTATVPSCEEPQRNSVVRGRLGSCFAGIWVVVCLYLGSCLLVSG